MCCFLFTENKDTAFFRMMDDYLKSFAKNNGKKDRCLENFHYLCGSNYSKTNR